MLTTLKLLDSVKKAHGNCSDYRAAQLLEVTRSTVSAWQRKHTIMEDKTAIKAAELLNLDPTHTVLCIHAEREKDHPSFHLLARLANKIEPRAIAAGFALLAVFCSTHPAPFFLA